MNKVAYGMVKDIATAIISTCEECEWTHHAHLPSSLAKREHHQRMDNARKVALYHVRTTKHSVTTNRTIRTTLRLK